MRPAFTLRLLAVLASLVLLAPAACDSGGGDGDTTDTAGDTGGGDTGGGDTTAGDTSSDDTTPGDTDEDTGPPVVACNAIEQSGCMDGENCTYADSDATEPSCVAAGAAAYGAACSAGMPCEKGICLSINQTDFLCYQFCKINAHCEAAGVQCLDLTDAAYKVCEIGDIYETCALDDQAACGAGKGCYVVSGEPEPVCLPAGDVAQGGDCANNANACQPGLACVGSNCLRLCDTTASQPCGDDFTPCVTYYQTVGYCDE